MTNCHKCGKQATNPQASTETQSIPYKQNGFVGDKFIPYDKKFKGVKTTSIKLCGLCYATEEVNDQIALGEDMNELHQELLKLAKEEVDGRANNPPTSRAKRNPKVARKRKSGKPMSYDQAITFDDYSEQNMATVQEALACECLPYVDVFTYTRWRAQGFQVQKGQHSIRIPVTTITSQEDDDGEITTRRLRTIGKVFCRHQVQPVEEAA